MDIPLRRAPTETARRRVTVRLAKRLLPCRRHWGCFSLVALWPESGVDEHRGWPTGSVESCRKRPDHTDLRYNSVDDRDRPYTVTASAAQQVSPERINLVDPKGDINLEFGKLADGPGSSAASTASTAAARSGRRRGAVRDDGLTMLTDSATLDLKAGVAVSAEQVHAEGPFGSLDAQGFAVTDHGTMVKFTGPGRLVLNARSR